MSDNLVLRVLGPVDVTGVTQALSSQQLAMLAYLACVGPARRETLIDAVWGGQPISAARFANLLSQIRSVIGREHLPATATGRYRLIGVPTDLDLLSAAVQRSGSARGAVSTGRAEPRVEVGVEVSAETRAEVSTAEARTEVAAEDELAGLEAAFGLVRGPVFDVSGERSWWWLDGHPEVVAHAEAAVGQVAIRLVTVLRDRGELDRARHVCDRALACSPLDRDLILALEGLHRAQGRPAAAHRLVERWRLQVERLTGEDPMALAKA